MLIWGSFEGHGTEAQTADLSSGDSQEEAGPGFIRAGCYFGTVRRGSLVRLALRERRAGALCKPVSEEQESLQPRPWGLCRQ